MKLTLTDVKTPCLAHGHSAVVRVEHEDEFAFIHTIEACQRCVDSAIEQYQEARVCDDCGAPVDKGNGIEKDGVLTPLCRGCQSKRLHHK